MGCWGDGLVGEWEFIFSFCFVQYPSAIFRDILRAASMAFDATFLSSNSILPYPKTFRASIFIFFHRILYHVKLFLTTTICLS